MLEIMQRQIDRTIVFHFADFIFFHVLFFNVMCFYQSSGSSKFVFNVYQSSALLSSFSCSSILSSIAHGTHMVVASFCLKL